MRITFGALADHATVSKEGKLTVVGIFDRINARSFPVRHASLVYVFRMLFEYEDSGKQVSLTVRLLDEDGAVLFSASGVLDIGKIPPGQFQQVSNTFEIQNLEFRKPGRYRFRVESADKAVVHDTVFAVVEQPHPTT